MKTELQNKTITALTACISRLKWHEEHLTAFPLDVAARQRAEKILDELLLDELGKPVAPIAETPAPDFDILRHQRLATPEGKAVQDKLFTPPIEYFTVIAVSSNTNSFGLKSIILLNEQGEGWEILKSPYGGEELPKQGDTIKRAGGGFAIGCECPRRLKDTSPAVARKVIADATKK